MNVMTALICPLLFKIKTHKHRKDLVWANRKYSRDIPTALSDVHSTIQSWWKRNHSFLRWNQMTGGAFYTPRRSACCQKTVSVAGHSSSKENHPINERGSTWERREELTEPERNFQKRTSTSCKMKVPIFI